MVISTKPYKKTSNPSNGKAKADNNDIYNSREYWLNPELDHNDRCKPAANCKGNGKCEIILDQTFSKPLMRLASFSGLMGVDIDQYEDLCLVCREHFYNNFYDHIWKDKPEIKCSQAIFELKMKENNAKDKFS